MQQQPPIDPATLTGFLVVYFTVIGILVVGSIILNVVMTWRILTRAGYQGPISFVTLIPGGYFVLMIILACTEWPIESQIKQLDLQPPVEA